MSAENVELVRRAYEAFGRGDIGGVMEIFDPGIEIFEADSMPYGGTYRGHEEMGKLFQLLNKFFEGFSVSVEHLFDGGDERVAALVRVQGRSRGTGQAIDMQVVEVWTLRGGKAVSLRPFYWDTAEVARVAGV